MTALTKEQIQKIYEKLKEEGQTFPVRIELNVGGVVVKGFIHKDCKFEEDL